MFFIFEIQIKMLINLPLFPFLFLWVHLFIYFWGGHRKGNSTRQAKETPLGELKNPVSSTTALMAAYHLLPLTRVCKYIRGKFFMYLIVSSSWVNLKIITQRSMIQTSPSERTHGPKSPRPASSQYHIGLGPFAPTISFTKDLFHIWTVIFASALSALWIGNSPKSSCLG